ncbi:MAG: hypothetical protein WAX89_07760 [Alphaproteobacteria bacterium]
MAEESAEYKGVINSKLLKGDEYQELTWQAMRGYFDVIVHGCDCFHMMNTGVSASLAANYPMVLAEDKRLTKCGDSAKLGLCTAVPVLTHAKVPFVVVNAYIYYHPALPLEKPVKVEYGAVHSCLRWVKRRYAGQRIGLPKLGCGFSPNGDWQVLKPMIDECLAGENYTICVSSY